MGQLGIVGEISELLSKIRRAIIEIHGRLKPWSLVIFGTLILWLNPFVLLSSKFEIKCFFIFGTLT